MFLYFYIRGLSYYFLLGLIPNGANPIVEVISLFSGSAVTIRSAVISLEVVGSNPLSLA